jgi:hypothetical protein
MWRVTGTILVPGFLRLRVVVSGAIRGGFWGDEERLRGKTRLEFLRMKTIVSPTISRKIHRWGRGVCGGDAAFSLSG